MPFSLTRLKRVASPLVFIALSGCTASNVFVAKEFVRPVQIAVLPVSNETTDLDGPSYIRKLIQERLISRGYSVLNLGQVDETLMAEGFTDGGQLGGVDPAKLGAWLQSDGLFYTTLVDFNYINLGYYWQRKVTVYGRLVSAVSGEKLWESERTWMFLNIASTRKEAQKRFFEQLGTQAFEKAMGTPLLPESRIAVERLIDTLP